MFKTRFFKEREVESLKEEAQKLQSRGQYAQAAEVYNKVAAAYLDDNPLIYASNGHQAFRLWLKAREAEKAMQQARAIFHVLDDNGWLRRSMEQVLDLKLMIDEFRSAGYINEAELFAGDLNNKLGEFGLMLKPGAASAHPSICPSCGAQLPQAEAGQQVICSFCGYVVPSG